MSGAGPRDGRTAGLRRQAGRDDGRMYGPSDAGYQARLKKLTAQQQEWNATATAAHEAAQTELFKTGVAAKNNTADQTACIGKLLSDIQQNKELPLVLAVRRWTSGMMGRAAKAVHSHGYGIVFLGDCAEVVDLAGTKNRTSVCIAQHWLRGAFPDRKGQFKQKRDARDALAEEIKKARLGRQVCFIDASVIGFSRYDWEEAQKVWSVTARRAPRSLQKAWADVRRSGENSIESSKGMPSLTLSRPAPSLSACGLDRSVHSLGSFPGRSAALNGLSRTGKRGIPAEKGLEVRPSCTSTCALRAAKSMCLASAG